MCFRSYVFLSQDTTTHQIDRVQQRISTPYEHYYLKDNIEKKRRTLLKTLVFVVVLLCFFPCHAQDWLKGKVSKVIVLGLKDKKALKKEIFLLIFSIKLIIKLCLRKKGLNIFLVLINIPFLN